MNKININLGMCDLQKGKLSNIFSNMSEWLRLTEVWITLLFAEFVNSCLIHPFEPIL